MKHIAQTTDGIIIALEPITPYDMVGYPILIDTNHKQFKLDKALWIELFDKTWPTDKHKDVKLVN